MSVVIFVHIFFSNERRKEVKRENYMEKRNKGGKRGKIWGKDKYTFNSILMLQIFWSSLYHVRRLFCPFNFSMKEEREERDTPLILYECCKYSDPPCTMSVVILCPFSFQWKNIWKEGRENITGKRERKEEKGESYEGKTNTPLILFWCCKYSDPPLYHMSS